MKLRAIACAWAFALACVSAWAADPQLGNIMPRGAQRGLDVEVAFQGGNLQDTVDIMFHDQGISLVEFRGIEGGVAKALLRIAPDCRVGTHAMRVRTATGISNLKLFSVGNLPEIQEAEPNNAAETAQALALPTVINGNVPYEDVDFFAVDLQPGARVAVEVEALRLGLALFDSKLRLFGPTGLELVSEDDTPLMRQDAAFVFTATEAGRHLLAVSEAAYGGNDSYFYRLHVGSFPRPLSMTPLGGVPGTQAQVTWLGDSGLVPQTIAVPAGNPGTSFIEPASDQGIAPTEMPFRLSEFPGVLEAEPNNAADQPTAGQVPGAFDGVIGEPGDIDWFQFEAKAGSVYDFRIWARHLGSPLDSILYLNAPSGGQIAGDDDAAGVDSYFRLTLPEDGVYKAWIVDHLKRGGPTFSYRLEIAPVKAGLTFKAAENLDAAVTVPQGNRTFLYLQANRTEFDGELQVAFNNLPAGVTAEFLPIPAGVGVWPVVLHGAPDAPRAGALVDVVGTFGPDPAAPQVTGHFGHQVVLVEGENLTIFQDRVVDKLAMAVSDKAPFEIRMRPSAVPVVKGSSKDLIIEAVRAEGFTAPITLRIPWLPNGLGAGTATIPEGVNEIPLYLEARAEAAVGEAKFVVMGNSAGWDVCTPFSPVQVSEPYVAFQVPNTPLEKGKSVDVTVKVVQNAPFEGTYDVAMGNFPNGITAPVLQVNSATTELKFTVTATADAPEGKHYAMVMSTTLTSNGEIIRHQSPGAELAVFAPLPAELQAAPPVEAAPDQPARKSRFSSGQ